MQFKRFSYHFHLLDIQAMAVFFHIPGGFPWAINTSPTLGFQALYPLGCHLHNFLGHCCLQPHFSNGPIDGSGPALRLISVLLPRLRGKFNCFTRRQRRICSTCCCPLSRQRRIAWNLVHSDAKTGRSQKCANVSSRLSTALCLAYCSLCHQIWNWRKIRKWASSSFSFSFYLVLFHLVLSLAFRVA